MPTQDVMYRYHHSNDVHEIVVNGSERGAVNGMFEVMKWVNELQSPHRLTRVLLVKKGTVLPLASFLMSLRNMVLRHPFINRRTPARFAVVTEKSRLVRLTQNLLQPIRVVNTVHFYGHPQYNEAQDWLSS